MAEARHGQGLIVAMLCAASVTACGQTTAQRATLAVRSPAVSPGSTIATGPVMQAVLQVPSSIASPSRPVFWYRDGDASATLVAYAWNGVRAGSLTLQTTAPVGVTPSPDGTRLLVVGAARLSGVDVLREVPGSSAEWAQDDAHLCQFRSADGRVPQPEGAPVPTELWLDDALSASADRRVLSYGAFGAHGGPVTLACNAPGDRAVIGTSFTSSVSDVRMLRFSDAAPVGVLPALNVEDGLRASADGRYLAVGDTSEDGGGPGPVGFDVIDLSNGAVVRHVDGSSIVAFSDDDSRALTVAWVGNSNAMGRYSLVDWRTGRVVWTRVLSPGRVFPRPHSGDFVVGDAHITPSRGNNRNTITEDAWIVRADGTEIHVASGLGALF